MTNEQTSTVIFKDQAGEYYRLPQATLEQGRVPDEKVAEFERLMAEAAARDDGDGDVEGFFLRDAYDGFAIIIGYWGYGDSHKFVDTLGPGLHR
jgi:hypothetical protein